MTFAFQEENVQKFSARPGRRIELRRTRLHPPRSLPARSRKPGARRRLERRRACGFVITPRQASRWGIPMDDRLFPARPILAVSAAVFRERQVLIVRRARAPLIGHFSLPGGVVEIGETLAQAIARELM